MFNKKSSSFLFAVALSVPAHSPDVLITGFQLEQSKENKKFIEMKAPEAEIYKTEQLAKIKFPETKIYQDNKPIEIKASEALAHLADYDVLFKGATEIKSPDGFIVQGRNISYLHKSEKIFTDEAIQFESTPDFKSSVIQGWGKGFEADLNVKSFSFKENVNMNIIPREIGNSPSKIRGNEAKVFTEKGWAQIEGNVAFQNQNLSLRSDFLTLNFDVGGKRSGEEAIFQSSGKSYVIALFDDYKLSSKEVTLYMKGRKQISRIKAQGEVTITDNKGLEASTETLEIAEPQNKNRKMKFIGKVHFKNGQDEGSCDEASLDPVTNYYVLKGNSVFKRGSDVLSGQEIRYSKATGMLQIIGASGQFQKNRVLPQKKI